MIKNKKIIVKGYDISVKKVGGEDYISLTDMLKAKDGDFFVKSWLRNRNTVEFLGYWEYVHNPEFNWVEFDLIRKEAGLNNFALSVEQWIEKTNAVGITATAGRYGGTYAHSDIAMEFGLWISPEFKVYFLQEFSRLKKQETAQLAWSAKRELAKINYHIQTDAIKENLILPALTQAQKNFVYADEADLPNVVMFGATASQWRAAHKAETDKGENMRDYATLHELLVLANLESHNANFIDENIPVGERLERLRGIAERELKVLQSHSINAPLLLDSDK